MASNIFFIFLLFLLAANALNFFHVSSPKISIPKLMLNSLCFFIMVLIFYFITFRLVTAMILTLNLQIFLLFLSNFKFKNLKEPFLYDDIYLYLQVFRFPRFYLAVFGYYKSALIFISVVLSLSAIIYLEEPFFILDEQSLLLNCLLSVFCILLILKILFYFFKNFKITGDIIQDINDIDFFPSLLVYGITSLSSKSIFEIQSPKVSIPVKKTNILAIQSESFFDPKKLPIIFNTNPLPYFEQLKKESMLSGELDVPVWGAYTMRTEFSFLTGIANSSLGMGKYNPFKYFKHIKLFTIVHQLKNAGYRCIFIHPFDKRFFGRNGIYFSIGFDEFIDISSFSYTDRYNVSDSLISDRIISLLKTKNEQPLFIFAVTIENHGPYNIKERYEYDITTRRSDNNKEIEDYSLMTYLQHLKSADLMVKDLSNSIKENDSDTMMIWYGDHLPILQNLYKKLDYRSHLTDYLVWHPRLNNIIKNSNLAVEEVMIQALSMISKENLPSHGSPDLSTI